MTTRFFKQPATILTEKEAPILIYQMGKVGSSSVLASLQALQLPVPPVHVHQLSDAGLAVKRAWYADCGVLDKSDYAGDLAHATAIRRLVDDHRHDYHWRIISLFREPVGLEISSIFENHKLFPHQMPASGNESELLEFSKIIARHLGESRENPGQLSPEQSYFQSWFDSELKVVFGVDVFAHRFDKTRGYSIIRQGNVSVLLIKLERLSAVFSQAVSDFLGIAGVELVSRNTSGEKEYRTLYHDITAKFSLPREFLKQLYSNRYSVHFYSRAERSALIRKWHKNGWQQWQLSGKLTGQFGIAGLKLNWGLTRSVSRPSSPSGYPGEIPPPKSRIERDDCHFNCSMKTAALGEILGQWDFRSNLKGYLGPLDFAGKKVLNLTVSDYHGSFYMERLGATVLTLERPQEDSWDTVPWSRLDLRSSNRIRREMLILRQRIGNAFWLYHQSLGSNVRLLQGSPYQLPTGLDPVNISTFRICLGQLRDPFLALATAAALTCEAIVVVEPDPVTLSGVPPAGAVFNLAVLPDSLEEMRTWWQLPPTQIELYLQALGFADTQTHYHQQLRLDREGKYQTRPCYTVVGKRTIPWHKQFLLHAQSLSNLTGLG
jgi:hypothetical protein